MQVTHIFVRSSYVEMDHDHSIQFSGCGLTCVHAAEQDWNLVGRPKLHTKLAWLESSLTMRITCGNLYFFDLGVRNIGLHTSRNSNISLAPRNLKGRIGSLFNIRVNAMGRQPYRPSPIILNCAPNKKQSIFVLYTEWGEKNA